MYILTSVRTLNIALNFIESLQFNRFANSFMNLYYTV